MSRGGNKFSQKRRNFKINLNFYSFRGIRSAFKFVEKQCLHSAVG